MRPHASVEEIELAESELQGVREELEQSTQNMTDALADLHATIEKVRREMGFPLTRSLRPEGRRDGP